MESMEITLKPYEDSYYLASYRTIVNPRLFSNPFPNTSHLNSSDDIFPHEYWHSGSSMDYTAFTKRVNNITFIQNILSFAQLEFATIYSHMKEEDYHALFNMIVMQKLLEFNSSVSRFQKIYTPFTGQQEISKVTAYESACADSLKLLLSLVASLRNINENVKSSSTYFERIIYTFHASDEELLLNVERFTSLTTEITDLIKQRLDYMTSISMPEYKIPSFTDTLSSELGIFKNNLDSILVWMEMISIRFTKLQEVYKSLISKNVPEVQVLHAQVMKGQVKQKISELTKNYSTPSWLTEATNNIFYNLTWFLLLTNYLLNHAIDVIYHGMQIFGKLATLCSVDLQNYIKFVSSWVVSNGKVISSIDYQSVDIVKEVKKYYKIAVRSCFVIAKTWHFEPMQSKYSDKVWEDERIGVDMTYDRSLDDTNVLETRAGIQYRIKRSNIAEAGLGLFFEDDVHLMNKSNISNKLSEGKWGLPLMIYNGEYRTQEDNKVLYGGHDALKPYSVSSTEGGPEMDAYDANKHDIARFINDPFNRLPEFGLNPDTRNPDPKKRTFTYNVYFLWCSVPKKVTKPKKRNLFSGHDSTVKWLRNTNDNKLDTEFKLLEESDEHTFVLAIYTAPPDKIPSADPESLFAKGEELWIQYGFDYIEKISSNVGASNIDYTYQSLGSFVFSRRSTIDVSIQEDIVDVMNFKTFDLSGDNEESAKRTFERAIVTTNILSVRPFNSVDSYYSYSLRQISRCFISELTLEMMKWLENNSDEKLSSPADYVSEMILKNTFEHKRLRRFINIMNKDVPMETMISILIVVCTCYYASILQLIDSSAKLVAARRQDYDTECLKYIDTIANEANVRISGIEKIKENMERSIRLLSKVVIAWYTEQKIIFDPDEWKDMVKYFRLDLDTCINKLKLSGLMFESYQRTREYMERANLGVRGIGNIKFILAVVWNMLNAKTASDYIDYIAWIPNEQKSDATILNLLENMFLIDTEQFVQQSRERMNRVIKAMNRSSNFKELIVNFLDPNLTPNLLSSVDSMLVVTTCLAYGYYSVDEEKIIDFPFANRNDGLLLIENMKGKHNDKFFPRWVYETKSEVSGKKPFLVEFNRMMRPIQESQESSIDWGQSSKKEILSLIPTNTTVISLDLTFNVDLKLGSRYKTDTYPRYGYVAEIFASREFGPNIEIATIELETTGESIRKSQQKTVELKLTSDNEYLKYITNRSNLLNKRLESRFATVGIYIKSKIKPYDSKILSEKMRLNYEGECYVQVTDKSVIGKKVAIQCKTFELDSGYTTIGTVTINSIDLSEGLSFTGEYSEPELMEDERVTDNIIAQFFDTILSEEITYHPGEGFLRNKHTPIWPNTPIGKMPSSLFVLNVPMGKFAWDGCMVFRKSLEIICSSYNVEVETELKSSLKKIVMRQSDYIPSNNDILELYATLRLIGESITLVPDLCDYKPDFTSSGTIGENYGEGTNGIDDCESLAKLGYSIGYSVTQIEHQEGSVLYYVKEILMCYVFGLIGCSSSRPSASGVSGADESVNEEYRGKDHINHIPAGMIPFEMFYNMCMKTGKYDLKLMKEYKSKRSKPVWYKKYLQPLLIEGTGNTVPLMLTYESQIESKETRMQYEQWANRYLETHYSIFEKYPDLSQFGFQDNSPLRFVSKRVEPKSSFSSFYTKFVHFWTGDMAENGGPSVTDFMFCYPGSTMRGSRSKWVYGVDFYDFVSKDSNMCLYPGFVFDDEEYKRLSAIAKKQVYPANIHSVNIDCGLLLIDKFVAPQRKQIAQSILKDYTNNIVIGTLSPAHIVAYTNHFEIYSEKKHFLKQLVEQGTTNVVECRIYRCEMSDITDLVQVVFLLAQ